MASAARELGCDGMACDVTDEALVRHVVAAADHPDAPLEAAIFNAGGNWPKAFRDMQWNSLRYCIGFPPERWYEIADEDLRQALVAALAVSACAPAPAATVAPAPQKGN